MKTKESELAVWLFDKHTGEFLSELLRELVRSGLTVEQANGIIGRIHDLLPEDDAIERATSEGKEVPFWKH